MFKQAKSGLLLSSVAYLVLGVCLIGWPDLSMMLACRGLGLVILVTGAVQVWHYLHREGHPIFAYLSLVYGVAALGLGLALLVWPGLFISVLPVVFGLFIIVDSVGRLAQAMDLKEVGYERWWVYLLSSLLSVLLGSFVLLNPFATMEAMVMALGVILLAEGVMNLLGALFAGITIWRLKRALEKATAEAEAADAALEAAVHDRETPAEGAFSGEEFPVEPQAEPMPAGGEGGIIDVESRPVE